MKKGWEVRFSDQALKSLKKMDRPTAAIILGFIEKRLDGCLDPGAIGKPFKANHSGKWRYRVGDYRLLSLLEDEIITITLIAIGHRKDFITVKQHCEPGHLFY